MKINTYNTHVLRLTTTSLLVLLFGFLCLAKTTNAQNVLPLLVAPARNEVTLTPGETRTVQIRFYNQGDVPQNGVLKVADFIVEDKQGTPIIIDDPNLASPKFSAADWADIPFDTAIIPENDKITVPVTFNVPQDARPGGRYVAVYFERASSRDTNLARPNTATTGTASRIAALIYIRIPGDTIEQAIISNLFTQTFYEYGPIKVNADILNRGDYHINPRGVFSMTNMIGGLSDQGKLTESNVFPDRARTYQAELGSKWMFGRYRVDLAVSYGEKGSALERYIYVWVFPWKIASAVILTLLVLLLWGQAFYKRVILRQSVLESELEHEREEVEALKEQIHKRSD